jgi:hypothetical protein
MMLRRIFWPKLEEATGYLRKVKKWELYDMNSSRNIMRVIN